MTQRGETGRLLFTAMMPLNLSQQVGDFHAPEPTIWSGAVAQAIDAATNRTQWQRRNVVLGMRMVIADSQYLEPLLPSPHYLGNRAAR